MREVRGVVIKGEDLFEIIDKLMETQSRESTETMVENMRFLAIMHYVTANYEAFNAHYKNAILPAYEAGLLLADVAVRKESNEKGMKMNLVEEAIALSKEEFRTKLVPRVLLRPESHRRYAEELDAIRNGIPKEEHKHSDEEGNGKP